MQYWICGAVTFQRKGRLTHTFSVISRSFSLGLHAICSLEKRLMVWQWAAGWYRIHAVHLITLFAYSYNITFNFYAMQICLVLISNYQIISSSFVLYVTLVVSLLSMKIIILHNFCVIHIANANHLIHTLRSEFTYGTMAIWLFPRVHPSNYTDCFFLKPMWPCIPSFYLNYIK